MSHRQSAIEAAVQESIAVKARLLECCGPEVLAAADALVAALASGHKAMFAGNGGSAADAQHAAAELVGRFRRDRAALAGVALTTDTSALTALANDFGVETIFARQVEAIGVPGDVLVVLSTSGSSPNVVAAARSARERGIAVVALTGEDGGAVTGHADVSIRVPSAHTARIQESHLLILHALCGILEEELAA